MLRSLCATSIKSSRTLSTSSVRMTHTLPALPYAYDGLEPAISKQIMTLHHTKHHQTYVNNLNKFEGDYSTAVAANDTKKQIALQSAIKFNGGGHINHSLFWENLAPIKEGGGQAPTSGPLADAIKAHFGGLDGLKAAVNASALAIQGSGWAWLGYNPTSGRLEASSTANQDPLLGHAVIIGVDLWEHAYYLDVANNKQAYLDNFWSVTNWKTAEKRFLDAAGNAKL